MKERINLILNTIDINSGLIMGLNGFIIGRFETANDMDQCFNTFANTSISLLDIQRDFNSNELKVKL